MIVGRRCLPRQIMLLAVLCALLASCAEQTDTAADNEATESEVVGGFDNAEALFYSIEERLTDAESVRIASKIQASGIVKAALDGTLLIQGANRVSLDFAGLFAAEQVYVVLISNGFSMRGGPTTAQFETAVPSALAEGILIGGSRMGFLHNLAVLSSGAPPERTDGTVRTWAEPTDFALGAVSTINGEPVQNLKFDLIVSGQPSASVNLWVSLKTRLPVRREQITHFDSGDMNVIEEYDEIVLNAPVPEHAFDF